MCLLSRKYPIVVCFLLLWSATLQAQEQASIAGSFPHEGSTDILRNAFISIKLNLPNGNLDAHSVDNDNIKLYPTGKPDEAIPAFITLNNKLRSLILEPYGMLSANTSYTFEITDRVKDQEGVPFDASIFTFQTGVRAYRKLITMNRPFGERPEIGDWKEEDVSGENLSAPFLREATPAPPAPKVVEEPKPLKPERSRDELLALVLRFYAGPKLPPGFGPTVLEAPKADPLPMAEVREVPFSFEALLAMSAPHPDDEFDERLMLPENNSKSEPQTPEVAEGKATSPTSISPEIDLKTQILEKWILASLVEMSFENEPIRLEAPSSPTIRRITRRKAPISKETVDQLLATVNQELIEEEKQTQMAIAAKAEREAEREAQRKADMEVIKAAQQALARKRKIQEKWKTVVWEDITVENSMYALQVEPAFIPNELAQREAPIGSAEFEELLASVNQELIEEEKGEQVALAEKATREAEQEASKKAEIEATQAAEQALAQKNKTQEKWNAVAWDEISIERPANPIRVEKAALPETLALRESIISTNEFETLLTQVNQSLIDDYQQEIAASEPVSDPISVVATDPEMADPKETTVPTPEKSSHLNTASLLVEETIKNAEKAGKIVFPQTAIFVNEYVTVEFDLPEREFVSFVLRDINGDVFRTEGGYVEAGANKRAVTLEGVPPGAYEAVVETIHQKVVRKVTILN